MSSGSAGPARPGAGALRRTFASRILRSAHYALGSPAIPGSKARLANPAKRTRSGTVTRRTCQGTRLSWSVDLPVLDAQPLTNLVLARASAEETGGVCGTSESRGARDGGSATGCSEPRRMRGERPHAPPGSVAQDPVLDDRRVGARRVGARPVGARQTARNEHRSATNRCWPE